MFVKSLKEKLGKIVDREVKKAQKALSGLGPESKFSQLREIYQSKMPALWMLLNAFGKHDKSLTCFSFCLGFGGLIE